MKVKRFISILLSVLLLVSCTAALSGCGADEAESRLIKANEKDFADFINYFSGYAFLNDVKSFNCRVADTEEIISFLFNGGSASSFHKVPEASTVKDDPLHKEDYDFYSDGTVFMLTEDSLRFICEEIFNTAYTEPEDVEIGSGKNKHYQIYGKGDKFYFWGGPSGGPGEYSYEMISHTPLNDGRYTMNVIAHWTDPQLDLKTGLSIVAGLKELDGKTFWSIYTIAEQPKLLEEEETTEEETTEEETTEPEVELLDASERDFADFIKTFSGYALLNTYTEFDCEKADTETILSFLFDGSSAMSFVKVPQAGILPDDPLNRMTDELYSDGAIYTITERDLQFICEDIFNTPYSSPEEIETGNGANRHWIQYRHEGSVYFWGGPGGNSEEYSYELLDHSANRDGKYELDVLLKVVDPLGEITNKGLRFVAALKEIDGSRFWSIYSFTEAPELTVVPEEETTAGETTTEAETTTTPADVPADEPWREALAAKLNEILASAEKPELYTFEIYDADEDTVPELYVNPGSARVDGGVGYSYLNGAYGEMGTFGSFGSIQYNKAKHWLLGAYSAPGFESFKVYQIEGGVLTTLAEYSKHSLATGPNLCTVNGEEVAQDVYDMFAAQYRTIDWMALGDKYDLNADNIAAALAALG